MQINQNYEPEQENAEKFNATCGVKMHLTGTTSDRHARKWGTEKMSDHVLPPTTTKVILCFAHNIFGFFQYKNIVFKKHGCFVIIESTKDHLYMFSKKKRSFIYYTII